MSACECARARVRVSQWGCGRARGGVSARGGRRPSRTFRAAGAARASRVPAEREWSRGSGSGSRRIINRTGACLVREDPPRRSGAPARGGGRRGKASGLPGPTRETAEAPPPTCGVASPRPALPRFTFQEPASHPGPALGLPRVRGLDPGLSTSVYFD